MALYELSIDPNLIREAEKVVSLEGRGFPTLVMRWESRLFDQPWVTTIVLDYTIALPPLMIGQSTFNEVKVCAFVGGAPTKFLYFGTEMSADVPRIAPEMENSVTPAQDYQEFRLEEVTCPIPYLKLIQTTPRIYGNHAQDYYSPPIKVERYDGTVGSDLLADYFAQAVANLEPVSGAVLTDAARGFWAGARFVGATSIAIMRQGKVVGLHKRMGRTDRDPVPAEIKKRDPKLDVLKEWVAVDVGAQSTTIALRGERNTAEFVRVGTRSPAVVPADFETPSEVGFVNLARFLKSWRERVILPITRWDDLQVGYAAKDMRQRPGDDQPDRRAACLQNISMLRERLERSETFRLRGRDDPETPEVLKRPAPPIIDEEGIGAHDPFDPIELFAYYVGVHVNHRLRGAHLRYAITMPTGWQPDRRQSVLVAFRRGFFRSLPVGLVEYHDLERLEVIDAGPATIPFSVHAFRVFNIQPRGEPVVFATIDAGASETAFLFGHLRAAKLEERSLGHEKMIEHIEPSVVPWLGAERLLHRLAFRVWMRNEFAMREAKVPMEKAPDEAGGDGDELLNNLPEARANKQILKDAIRPLLEGTDAGKVSPTIRLLSNDRRMKDVPIEFDRDELVAQIHAWIDDGAKAFKEALASALERIGKGPDPFDGVRVLLGGRFGMHPHWGDELTRIMPANVQIHRFREPDKTNIQAPTVKTATVLGVLGMRWDRIGAVLRSEKRETFRYRVGRNRHGQLTDVLDPSIEYDVWREMGPCLKPDVDILFMAAQDDGEIAADDPRVSRATCSLGASAVGQRVYLRAVQPSRVEVSVGPPNEEPERGAPCWSVELATGVAHPV